MSFEQRLGQWGDHDINEGNGEFENVEREERERGRKQIVGVS